MLAGLAVLFILIPYHTETIGSAGMKPQTVPRLCAIFLVFLGSIQAAFPTGRVSLDYHEMARFAYFTLLAIGGLWLFSLFGFRIAAPVMALAVMLSVGERRIGWIAAGVIVLPAVVWFAVAVLLDRPLP